MYITLYIIYYNIYKYDNIFKYLILIFTNIYQITKKKKFPNSNCKISSTSSESNEITWFVYNPSCCINWWINCCCWISWLMVMPPLVLLLQNGRITLLCRQSRALYIHWQHLRIHLTFIHSCVFETFEAVA